MGLVPGAGLIIQGRAPLNDPVIVMETMSWGNDRGMGRSMVGQFEVYHDSDTI
ncbi:MAG: hypothetical protein N839_0008675 [Desulfofustis sp. PB-SRB1]|jgi:hypothetical protein|nr:hypothetical protein [Desulfofustis sp. PB-SRB1]MBM1002475.1 hypothetical protein [Desulfofustis sp. PB-SRB1]